jgi:hypothetical protein
VKGVAYADAKRAFLVARRVIAIAGSKEYDEDVVCHMLENAEEELRDEGWRFEDTEISAVQLPQYRRQLLVSLLFVLLPPPFHNRKN